MDLEQPCGAGGRLVALRYHLADFSLLLRRQLWPASADASFPELGLIDEYEFVVQPKLAGHGPTLFAGLSKHVDLRLVSRLEFGSGAVAMRYEPRR
jgi:hypothetical protein